MAATTANGSSPDRMSNCCLFGKQRIGEAAAFQGLISDEGCVELKIPLPSFANDNADLIFADFDDIRLCCIGHDLTFAGDAGVLLFSVIMDLLSAVIGCESFNNTGDNGEGGHT